MKKKLFLSFITLAVYCSQVSAQAPIVRQNGSVVNFYNNVPAAITAANNGDTIYIPGGSWNIGSSFIINKTLHIIGTGHNPDSSQASGITYFTGGNIILQQGCDNGSLWGIFTQNGINTTNSNDVVLNFSIRRCRFQGPVEFSSNFSSGLIAENVFDNNVHGTNSTQFITSNNTFVNNIFSSCIFLFGSGNTFNNNLFINPVYCAPNVTNCFFKNNVFFTSVNFQNIFNNCLFNNNLFSFDLTFPFGTNLGSNNIVNQSQSGVFIAQSGVTYNYSHNYHLQASCQGVNAGTDGTDIGIYGGMLPWIDGSVPSNPHIQQKSIGTSTDQNGNLQINIKVKAQGN